MTKAEYISFVKNTLQKLDRTARYHDKVIEKAIEQAFNTAFYALAQSNPKSLERYSALLTSQSVSLDATTGLYYTTLSEGYVDLPFKASGILGINADTGTDLDFVPMSVIEFEQFSGLEGSLPDDVIGFSAQNGLVEYWNMDAVTAAAGVKIRLVRLFSEYASTDNVPSPFGQDQKLIESVRQQLSSVPPVDLINDNSDLNGKS